MKGKMIKIIRRKLTNGKQHTEDMKKAEQVLNSNTYTIVQYVGNDSVNLILQHNSFKMFNYTVEAILDKEKIIYTVVNTEGKREKLNYPNSPTYFITNFEKI